MKLWQMLLGQQAPSGPVAYRYWRISISANNGNASYTGLSEVELRTTEGGTDVTSPSTVVTSGTLYSGSYPGSNTVDNNTGTMWLGSVGANFLMYDLSSPTVISEIRMYPYSVDSAPKDFVVQGSNDGVTFTDVVAFTGTTFVGSTWKTLSMTPPTHYSTFLTLTGFSGGFSNPSYATVSNNQYATATHSGYSGISLTFSTDATTKLPAGKSLSGVKVYVEGKCVSDSINITSLGVGLVLPAGSLQLLPTEGVSSVGGKTELMGVSSASDLSSMSLRFVNQSGSSNTSSVDEVRVEIFWPI